MSNQLTLIGKNLFSLIRFGFLIEYVTRLKAAISYPNTINQ